ncbi:serine O-acetyltransferase [Entamoeba marina]
MDTSLAHASSALFKKLTILIDHIYSSLSAYQDDDDELTNIIECLLQKLPDIREIIKTDLIATYAGDPAAPNLGLLIRCYPSISAMMIYRIANILYNNGDKCYCRELMETLHSHTGIDIHPGATIGSHLFIDHGVGVVIGETCIIGDWCRIYQQINLEYVKKGIKRHPTIRNGVTIGAGAKVLGNIIIGSNVKIGANCWVCENIDDDVVVYISDHPTQTKKKPNPIITIQI